MASGSVKLRVSRAKGMLIMTSAVDVPELKLNERNESEEVIF